MNEAIRCYDQAISLDPNDPIALVNKGNALSALKPNEAVAAYNAALKIDPHSDAAWFNLGMHQQNQEQHEKRRIEIVPAQHLEGRQIVTVRRPRKVCETNPSLVALAIV